MKRILFIATTNLHERNGGALATLAYYNAVKSQSGRLVDLALPSEYCHGLYATAISVRKRNRFRSIFKILLKGRFHRYKDFFSKYLQEYHNRYSMVIINGGFYAGDMVEMFHAYNIKVLVIHHNYEPEYHLDNKTLPTLGGLTSYFVKRNERRAYLYSDLNAFLTTNDISAFRRHYGECSSPCFLLSVFEPNTSSRTSTEITSGLQKRVIITGSMNAVQTKKGIMDFSRNYYNLFCNICSGWELVLAGREPQKQIVHFALKNHKNVKLISNPEDIDSIICSGSIFLCPTNVGGGLKLRVMDGLKNGLPVLVHKISARGYDMFFENPFFQVYEDQRSFEEGMVKIKHYVENHKDFAQNILTIYNSYFSYEAGCLRVRQMLDLIEY